MTRIGTVTVDGRPRLAVLDGDSILVGQSAGAGAVIASGLPISRESLTPAPNDTLAFQAPIRPPILLCCGQNYSDHLAEQGHERRSEPEFFIKAGQTIADPAEPFALDPRLTRKLDYETELAVVVGRRLRRASVEEAEDAIFGYVVMNDVSARDRQIKEGGRPALGPGKTFDGATRLGQWVVTADEVADPQTLRISTRVNGELRQSNTTANMIYGCAEILSFYSILITLEPGTIVATGTPGGTALGCDHELGGLGLTPAGCEPARYLRPGDTVVSEVEGVGDLSFTISATTDA